MSHSEGATALNTTTDYTDDTINNISITLTTTDDNTDIINTKDTAIDMDIITTTAMNDVTVDDREDIQKPKRLKHIASSSEGGFPHITTLNMEKKPAIRFRHRKKCMYIKAWESRKSRRCSVTTRLA